MRLKQRKRLGIFLCQILLFCVLLLTGCHMPEEERGEAAEDGEREEPDQGFWNCVRELAGIQEGDTEADIREKLAQCESLVLQESPYGVPLYSLKDLEYLPHLKSLSIEFHPGDKSRIEDFTPIAELPELKQLRISCLEGEGIDGSFLGEMKTITELHLDSCQLKDTEFLREMPQLERLSLCRTPIEDLAVLENLTELRELSLTGNKGASRIEALGKLRKLEKLELRECAVRDISFLSSLTELWELDLSSNFITDIAPLAGLIHLNQVDLSDNQIEDFSPLGGKTDLMSVFVSGNPCMSLKPVLEVPQLCIWPHVPSEEQQRMAAGQVEKKWPDLEEYVCIDWVEGDLNGDGRLDAAFVVDGTFGEIEGMYGYNYPRRLVILLRQADGSFRELTHEVAVWDKDAGGTRGDPYRGIWMEEGCFLLQQSWGSRTGGSQTEFYIYDKGKLELSHTTTIYDSRFPEGYDVTVYEEEDSREIKFSIDIRDDGRMVREPRS